MNWTYGFLFALLQFSLIEAQPTRSFSYRSDVANKVNSPTIIYKEHKNAGHNTEPALKTDEEFDFNNVLKYLPPHIVQKIQESSKTSSPNSPIAILLAANFPKESLVNLNSEEETRDNPADENTKININDKTYDGNTLKPDKITSEMAVRKEIYNNNNDQSDQPQIEPEQQQDDRIPAGNHEVLDPDLHNRVGVKGNKVSQDSNNSELSNFNVNDSESIKNIGIPLEYVSNEPDYYKATDEDSSQYDLLIKHEEIQNDLEDVLRETLKDKVQRISEDHAHEIVDHADHPHSLDEKEQIARGGNPDQIDKSHTIAHLNKLLKEESKKNLLNEEIPEDSDSKILFDDDTETDHKHESHEDFHHHNRFTKPHKHHHSMEHEDIKTYNLSFVFSK